MNDITKIIRSLEESGLLIKRVLETIKNEAKEQKLGFLWMLLGTFGAILLFILFIFICNHIYCWSTMLAITNKSQQQ